MPRSMTGFARQESQYPWGSLACEIRSVNHRYLEPSLRLSEPLRALEPELRETLRKAISRGKIEIGIQLKTENATVNDLALNTQLASQIASLAQQVEQKLDNPAQLNPMDILRWPGVLKAAEIDSNELDQAAKKLFKDALQKLIENRSREGTELQNFILQRLQTINELVSKVRIYLPELQSSYKEKLRSKVESLRAEVDEERFNQEIVYLCQKTDIAEELDRIDAHSQEVTRTLEQQGPIGRRLDFLMQELNREANTLSSKSISTNTSQIAVDLKVLIEQMREQIQNIE